MTHRDTVPKTQEPELTGVVFPKRPVPCDFDKGPFIRCDRKILAAFDQQGIFVYQAYCPHIAHNALANGTFGEGFGMRRMSWVKPSFGWMLYRSNYGESRNQEVILRIKLTHEGWKNLLKEAVLASFDAEIHGNKKLWKEQLQAARVRVQWDPDRDLAGNRVAGQRAIQIGIGPELLPQYVKTWIIGLEDVTAVAKDIKQRLQNGAGTIEHPYAEKEYCVEPALMMRLGMTVELHKPKHD